MNRPVLVLPPRSAPARFSLMNGCGGSSNSEAQRDGSARRRDLRGPLAGRRSIRRRSSTTWNRPIPPRRWGPPGAAGWWAGGDDPSKATGATITPDGVVTAEKIPGGRCGSIYANHVTGQGFGRGRS